MIAGRLASAMGLVDAAGDQPVGQFRGEQGVVDPEPVITLPGPGLIVPIGPHPAARIVQLKRVGRIDGHVFYR